jgi:hypothetical protein
VATASFAAQETPERECAYLNDARGFDEVVIQNDRGVDSLLSDDLPYSVRLRYPIAALTYPQAPREPAQTAELFTLYADTGLPFPREDRLSERGRLLPAQVLPPINLLVHDGVEVEHVVAVFEGMDSGLPFSYQLRTLKLKPSDFGNLHEIEIQSIYYAAKERRFINIVNEKIADLVVCAKKGGHVRYPHCQHYFDYRALNIKSTFSAAHLSKFRLIKSRVEKFISCIYRDEFLGTAQE